MNFRIVQSWATCPVINGRDYYLFTLGFLGIGVIADLLQIVFGARTDKNKVPIGKHNKKYRKAINVGSVVAAIFIWFRQPLR
jgi:hypothetical protein